MKKDGKTKVEARKLVDDVMQEGMLSIFSKCKDAVKELDSPSTCFGMSGEELDGYAIYFEIVKKDSIDEVIRLRDLLCKRKMDWLHNVKRDLEI